MENKVKLYAVKVEPNNTWAEYSGGIRVFEFFADEKPKSYTKLLYPRKEGRPKNHVVGLGRTILHKAEEYKNIGYGDNFTSYGTDKDKLVAVAKEWLQARVDRIEREYKQLKRAWNISEEVEEANL